jgi:GNAT superfamily N-acetyltransferase
MEGSRLTVELLDPSVAADVELPEALTTLVNRVYAVGEAGLWQEGSGRLLPGEMAEMIGAGQIAVARLQGEIVGSVHIRLLEDGRVGELGLLTADPEHRGIGVGRALADFAEGLNRSRGARLLQLQLLVPTAWEHPVKRFLYDWYSRRGYVVVARRPMAEVYPDLDRWLATPCLLLTMQKPAEEGVPPTGGGGPGPRARLRIVPQGDEAP